MSFPKLVYRCPGPHFAHAGQTYEYAHVLDEQALRACLNAGWSVSLAEAVAAVTAAGHAQQVADDGDLSRAELEEMAGDLGIKFDGRTTDAALLRKIEAAIQEKS